MTTINIDSSAFVCDNQWGISGAWYCYSDPAGSSTNCGANGGQGINPVNSMGQACLNGTTMATSPSAQAYGAGLGFELNHPSLDAGAAMAYNAQSHNIVGFAVTLQGDTGGAPLRIAFPPGLTTNKEAPSVTVPGLSGGTSTTYTVLLKDAIIADNNSGMAKVVDPTDITSVEADINVDGIAHKFNYCITKVVPVMMPPAAPATLAAYGPPFTAGTQPVLTGLGAYGVQPDPFNSGGQDGIDQVQIQAQYGNGQAGFVATVGNTFSHPANTPGAFPSIVYGWINGGNFVGQSGGGYTTAKAVGNLTAATSNWTWSAAPQGGNQWDAAYDCWLAENPAPLTPTHELMVWLGHAGVNPIGGQNTAVTISGAPAGTTWAFSTGTNGTGQPVVSYVNQSADLTKAMNFNLLPFFQDAANNGRASIAKGTLLLGCQTGFELYGSGVWTTSSFSMSIN